MLTDANKGIINITYNHLNLPVTVTFSGTNKKIDYFYDAIGTKLKKVVTDASSLISTEYAGNYVYENGILKQISHKEGYLEPKAGGGYQYVYRMADIWGNTRITYADDNGDGIVINAEIRREQNYYPFGLEHRGYNNTISGPKNNLKTYQGQEFTDDLNLNTHEWKFRVSDPAIGRFWQIDPLTEKYTYNSTYAFQENKLGMGTELEGSEMDFFPWLAKDAAKNPNGIGAHTLGFAQGLGNAAKGAIDAVSNPVQTLKSLGDIALFLAVGSQFSGQVDNALGTNSTGAGDAILNSVVQGGDNLINGNGIERGTVLGEVAGAVIGAKGANAAIKAVSTAIKANESVNVFRVFGGDAKAEGFSYTTKNPNSVSNFRDAAGLPSGGASGANNTGRFVIEGSVKNKNIIKTQSADPLDGNKGGLLELKINPNDVKINRVSGANPEF